MTDVVNVFRVGTVFGAVLVFGSVLALGQGRETVKGLSEQDLVALHAAGCSDNELSRVIERHGPGSIDVAALARLRELGIPAAVALLEEQLRRAGHHPLTPADVVALLRSGMPEVEVVERIAKSKSCFSLTVDDVLGLVRDGVPASVIRAMREQAAKATVLPPKALNLDELVAMTEAGLPGSEILRRIHELDAHFRIEIDDLVVLSRKGVPLDVLKEAWARREGGPDGDEVSSSARSEAAPAQDTAHGNPRQFSKPPMMLHREPSGGFSILVPADWYLHRESHRANALLSFTEGRVPEGGGLADAEIQLFRYRSQNPERLNEHNLDPIGGNFLNRLKASFAARNIAFSFGKGEPTSLAGRPARGYRVSSSSEDGTTHEGEVLVTFDQDQVFVISYAVRAERSSMLAPRLLACARSFTIERDPEFAVTRGRPEEELATLFDAWRRSVKSFDFSLYRNLGDGLENLATRASFVELAQRFQGSNVRLNLGKVVMEGSLAQVECLVLEAGSADSLMLTFERTEAGFRLKSGA